MALVKSWRGQDPCGFVGNVVSTKPNKAQNPNKSEVVPGGRIELPTKGL